MPRTSVNTFGKLPRPGRAVTTAIVTLVGVWALLAAAIQWFGAPEATFSVLTGDATAIAHGQVWRLFTAPFVHDPSELGPILFSVLGIYLIGTGLERTFRPRRILQFLVATAWLAYLVQLLVLWALPDAWTAPWMAKGGHWSGAFPAVEAAAMAWACSYRGSAQKVALFGHAVTPRFLIGLVIGVTALWVAFSLSNGDPPHEGLIAPPAGLLAGWLLGGATPSPARRFYLKFKLARLEREQHQQSQQRRMRVKRSGLRVIPGGATDTSPKKPPKGKGPNKSGPPPNGDGRLLN